MEHSGHRGTAEFQLRTRAIARLVLLGAFVAGTAAAQESATTIDDLDQRFRILERELEIQKEEAATTAGDASTASVGDKGVSVKKGDFKIRFKGLVQADLRAYTDDQTPRFNDTFTLRRLRPMFEGSFGKLVGFRLTPEFAGAGGAESASLVDAYIDLKFDPAATLRIGKVKGPVALERLRSGGSLSFVERGFPTELAPNRDLGAQLQGELFGSTVNYSLGVYNGTADGRDVTGNDVDNKKELGARLFVEPFRNEPGFFQNLGLGVGSSFGSKDQGSANAANANSFLPRYRTPGQNLFFSYRSAVAATPNANPPVAASTGVYADGDHTRSSPQFYFYRNAFGLLGEYIGSEQELHINASSDKLKNTAWQIVTSYVLTGEDAGFHGVAKSSAPYAVGGPGWGALELAARYGELKIDGEAFPVFANINSSARKASAYTVGVNWVLNSNVKIVINYSHTSFDGGAANGADRDDEKAIFSRVQLSF